MTTRVMRPQRGDPVRGDAPSLTHAARKAVTERLDREPQWSEYMGTGAWLCPYCLEPVAGATKGDDSRADAISNHLTTRCGPFRAGAGEETRRREVARAAGSGLPSLVERIRQSLHSRIWRYRSRNGSWVCPYCLAGVSEISLGDAIDWDRTATQMAFHLSLECKEFRNSKALRQSEEAILQAIGDPDADGFEFLAPAPL